MRSTPYTWVNEVGQWRRLWLPKTGDTAEALMKSGDYEAAKKAAERWLEKDPFGSGLPVAEQGVA